MEIRTSLVFEGGRTSNELLDVTVGELIAIAISALDGINGEKAAFARRILDVLKDVPTIKDKGLSVSLEFTESIRALRARENNNLNPKEGRESNTKR